MLLFGRKHGKRELHTNEDWAHYSPLRYVTSFSKAITLVWLVLFAETVLFSQIATVFSLGDALAIQYVNDTVKEIGMVICGFYFSSKCLENIAQGYEEWKTNSTYCESDEDSETVEI